MGWEQLGLTGPGCIRDIYSAFWKCDKLECLTNIPDRKELRPHRDKENFLTPVGFEPTTSGTDHRCSTKWAKRPVESWWWERFLPLISVIRFCLSSASSTDLVSLGSTPQFWCLELLLPASFSQTCVVQNKFELNLFLVRSSYFSLQI